MFCGIDTYCVVDYYRVEWAQGHSVTRIVSSMTPGSQFRTIVEASYFQSCCLQCFVNILNPRLPKLGGGRLTVHFYWKN